ncbi:TcaA second domain-containing protein [Macrococcus carouselicus]|uniref:Zinc-ribbon domain-containing protein n=1 Tax=Macrococcus carouselicus TaxID=69969 RepID=A0A9Q8CJR4_9STAP|nr:zinc-ribbon domain-containing protein [Macrococcus carouselicus]TDL96635.1 zinc-ribbon domain-containing protein [Macrococcus carouselicus]
MKFCRNCGAEVKENQKVCTQCGTAVNQQPETVQMRQETIPGQPMSRSLKILLISSLAALVLLFGVYKLLESQFSVTNQADKIAAAVTSGNSEEISNLITSDGKKLTEPEANAFIKYMKAVDTDRSFNTNLKTSVQSLEQTKLPEASVYLDDSHVMRVTEEGRKMGLFRNYTFSIPKQKMKLYGNDFSTVKFKAEGKEHNIETEPNNPSEVGMFTLGDYQFDATKTVDKTEFKGKLNALMSESEQVTEDFDFTYLTVSFENGYELDEDSYKVMIDGKEAKLQTSSYGAYKVGPFKIDQTLEIKGEGKLGDETFKTETESVTTEKSDEEQLVMLSFNEEEISDASSANFEKEIKQSEEQSDRRSVDINSDAFNEDFIHTNALDGYRDIKMGMTKDEVEELLGEDSSLIDSTKDDMRKYGDIAIDYDKKDKVERIMIIPSWPTSKEEIVDEFGSFIHSGQDDYGESASFMDSKINGFALVFVFDDDDDLKYIYQRDERATDPWKNGAAVTTSTENADEETASEEDVVTNAAEAKQAALDFADGSFDEGSNEVRAPEKNDTGWGFGIFDADGNAIKSYDIQPDGYVIEYNGDGEQVNSGYTN